MADRSLSPTRGMFQMRQEAQEKLGKMAMMGLHVFNPYWNQEGFAQTNGDCTKASHLHSGSFRDISLKIHGGKESFNIPVQVCTQVFDVKCAIAGQAMVSPDQISIVMKQGCSYRVQLDTEEIARVAVVKGIRSFQPEPAKWPHTTIFIGAGYNGIKHALLWADEGNMDFQIFERYDRIGGHAWLVQANKTSKLQTEMGAFHVWFGTQWNPSNPKLGYPTEWATWPKKDEVIQHIQYAAERYGITPQVVFKHEVRDLQIVGKLTDHDRTYRLTVEPLMNKSKTYELTTNIVYHFPGAYFNPRIIDYPGQDEADLHIGYGMNDDMPYDYLEGNVAAILGNGAFAVENIRTCVEYGVSKVWLVTRKKNLPSPRLSCWFVHQSITPVPAKMLLDTFIPMYDQCGFDDPWQYHSVYASKSKEHCTINSHSRFGIGDVTFLAVAWGRCEYVVDLLKRCTYHTLHLQSGKKLEDVRVLVKALGLIADWSADRFHKVKEMIGTWPHGDHRRIIYADPVGMHAANFACFSTGVGSYVSSLRDKYLVDFPQEYYRIQAMGVVDMLPKHKAIIEEDRPCHQYDAKYATSASMVLDGSLPRMLQKMAGMDAYFHKMMWAVNPFDKYYAECKASWDQYQNDWWKMGFQHDYVPYPYKRDYVTAWFERYRATVGATEPNPHENYTLRANGRVLDTYVPSWERADGQVPPIVEDKEWDIPYPKPKDSKDSGSGPGESQTQVEQEKVAVPQNQGPSDEEMRAHFESKADPNQLQVIDPVIGSVFNETPWDQGGSRYWWATTGTNGRY